jgi:YbbR domain-containing protein
MWWLVFALLLGVAILILMTNNENQEMEIAVPVTISNLADDLLLIDAQRQMVKVVVAGSVSSVDAIDPLAVSCRLDLTGKGKGTHTIPIEMSDVTLPKKITLKRLLTSSLTIQLEQVAVKTVDVIAVLAGYPATGFAVVDVSLTPNRITLRGRATMLADIDTVKTRPIDLEAAAEPFKKEVPLSLPEVIAVDPPLRIVIAQVDIKERIITRVLENVPVAGLGSAAGHQIRPETITLTVSGPENIVNGIESDPAFAVTVDLTGLPAGSHRLTATINLPVQTKLVQVSPERFSVTIPR